MKAHYGRGLALWKVSVSPMDSGTWTCMTNIRNLTTEYIVQEAIGENFVAWEWKPVNSGNFTFSSA